MKLAKNIVIIAASGSTIPDSIPKINVLLFFIPLSASGIEIIAPSGKF